MSILRSSPCLLAFLLLVGSAGAAAEPTSSREAQMAAAYVFNFAKFVEWPPHAQGDTLNICFLGADAVRAALADATADKRVGSRGIVVQALARGEKGQACHVIYVDAPLERELANLHTAAALTIGESESFTRAGGVIRLYTENNRLRFIVNVANAKRAGLSVSSNLLQLATRVELGAAQ